MPEWTKELKAAVKRIKSIAHLPPAPDIVPYAPSSSIARSAVQEVRSIQAYIESFEYNYSGVPFVTFKRTKSMLNVYKVAMDIMKAALPIQVFMIGCSYSACNR